MKIPFRKDANAIAKAERAARFQNAIELAHEIVKIDAGGLVAYVLLIDTPLQSRATLSAAFSAPHGAQSPTSSIDSLFFDIRHVLNENGERADELTPPRADRSYRFRLGANPVIATLWSRARHCQCSCN